MKYSGRARQTAFKMLFGTLVALVALFAAGCIALLVGHIIHALIATLLVLWALFALFTLYFFRDPNPRVPSGANLVVSPAHGKIDVIDELVEPLFMEGPCQRISIFLSVFDVHVQNAPVSGRITYYKYKTGQFLNALKTESAAQNENVLLGIECSEKPGARVGLRLIAGLIARRIVPFVSLGDETVRGERVSLIQFGSRTDLYLPLSAKIQVKLGDKAVGGETIMATLD